MGLPRWHNRLARRTYSQYLLAMSHAEVVSSSLTRGTVLRHVSDPSQFGNTATDLHWQTGREAAALKQHLLDYIFSVSRIDRKTAWARPGFEPGTSRTLSENHTPRPTSQLMPTIGACFESKSNLTCRSSQLTVSLVEMN